MDCRDGINRKTNFIMFRVEECDSVEAIESKEHDTKFIKAVLQFALIPGR